MTDDLNPTPRQHGIERSYTVIINDLGDGRYTLSAGGNDMFETERLADLIGGDGRGNHRLLIAHVTQERRYRDGSASLIAEFSESPTRS